MRRSLSFRWFTRPLIALLVVALVCSSFVPPAGAQTAPTKKAAKLGADEIVARLQAAEITKTLRTAYMAGDLHAYRLETFRVFIAVRELSGSAAAKFMDDLAVAAKTYGGDGLEPIFLVTADAIVRRGDVATKNRLKGMLSTLKGNIAYQTKPGPNFLIPLTHSSSFLALDVRVDVVRAMIDVMLDRAAQGERSGIAPRSA